MKKNVISIPYNDKATLRIDRSKIVATVSVPGSDHIDIYTMDTATPWHVHNIPADNIVNLIWDEED